MNLFSNKYVRACAWQSGHGIISGNPEIKSWIEFAESASKIGLLLHPIRSAVICKNFHKSGPHCSTLSSVSIVAPPDFGGFRQLHILSKYPDIVFHYILKIWTPHDEKLK
jgi:hypothetical protein